MYLFSNILVLKPSFDNRNMQAHYSLQHQQNDEEAYANCGKKYSRAPRVETAR